MKRILPLLLTLTATTANAQVLSQTAGQTGTATRFGGGIALSSVEYEEDRDFEVERKVLVGHMLLPLETDLALIGQAGFIFDSEIDDLSGVDDGKGFLAGIGVLATVHREGRALFDVYGLGNYTSESWDGDGFDIELAVLDVHVGGTVLYDLGPKFKPYGGLDLAIHSDGEIEADFKRSGKADGDADRDGLLSMRIGAHMPLTSALLRIEAILIGEQTIWFGATF